MIIIGIALSAFIEGVILLLAPQIVVLSVLLFCKTKVEFISGTALTMIIYLFIFYFLFADKEPMVWLLYLYLYPGVLVATVAVGLNLENIDYKSSFSLFTLGVYTSITGLVLNLLVMYFAAV